jgi:O-antigen/teichoic acid export membrane protein
VAAGVKAVPLHRLKRRALSLGAVKAFDHAMQFLLPVLLARCLDAATFGEYRLLWLVVGTVVALASLNMGGSLFYFLPRLDAGRKKVYIHNTVLYLLGAGALLALAVSPWNPLLPASLQPLARYGALVPAFVALWLAGTLLDLLPTIEERIRWQACASISVAALRVVLVGAAAWFTGELQAVLWLLLAVVVLKLGLLAFYVHRHHGLGRPWFQGEAFHEQWRYSLPFGVSTGLFSLRGQVDQWVAASLFALSSFAAFTIAALVGQVVYVFRHSVMQAFLPSMSRLQAAGDVRGMMQMNARANAMVGAMLYPLLALAFVFAEEIVSIVYTAAFIEAAPVMRVYIVGMAAMVIEVGSIVLLLRQGPFVLRVSALVLAVSAVLSWAAAHEIGLTGAAVGSVVAIYLDRTLVLGRVARHTGIALRDLQHWGALAWALGTAALAALLAWAFAGQFLAQVGPLGRLLGGALVLALAYAAMNYRLLGDQP